jgi:S-methyl-1-thioxylulose 5-phosphate methylthiotransferase
MSKHHIPQAAPFRWKGVPLLVYKEDAGTHFKAITRQVLLGDEGDIGAELRYFEIAPGGHSTLERHDHAHSVMIIRGRGKVLVGAKVHALGLRDLVRIPSQTWHQFRATGRDSLGFLCLVRTKRDKPHRPTAGELASIRSSREAKSFIRV